MSQHLMNPQSPLTHESSADSHKPPAPLSGSARRWRRPSPIVLIVAVLALAGVVLLQLPGIASWFSQLEYSREITSLSEGKSDALQNQAAIAEAHAYNAGLTGQAVVGAGERIPQATDTTHAAQYSDLLAADSTGLMARIKIPAIDADLPIYHGTSDEVLLKGVGHLEGTALPVGGVDTHTVLTGHRGLATAEIFSHLDQVAEGDTFTIEVFGEVLTYRVFDTRVVEPDETESLFPVQGKDLATLVTCTPLGINSHRILVTGERMTPTPQADLDAAGAEPTVPGFPWWAVGTGAAILLIGSYVVASCRTRAPRSAN